MERHFEQELEQLKSKLLAMSALVESVVYRGELGVLPLRRLLVKPRS